MGKYVRLIFRIICVSAVLLLYMAARQSLGRLSACEKSALILMETSPLNAARLEEMRRGEAGQELPREFTAWSQENEVQVENKNLLCSHTVAAVAVCGRSDLVLPGTARLDEEDLDGCLIDENTARKLFGNTNVTGLSVEIGGKKKTIRGILYDAEDTVLYEESSADQKFTSLTVSLGNNTTYDTIRQDFMARHALAGKFVRMDTLGWILEILCALVPLIVGLRILKPCLRAAWVYRAESTGILIFAGTVACAALLLWLLAGQIRLPEEMIPTKWSDFSFWSSLMEKERESLLLLLLTEKQRPLQMFVRDFYLGSGACLAAGILALKIKI